jgi:hypothetical protein
LNVFDGKKLHLSHVDIEGDNRSDPATYDLLSLTLIVTVSLQKITNNEEETTDKSKNRKDNETIGLS